jgi:vancomycin resistance protein YoaR
MSEQAPDGPGPETEPKFDPAAEPPTIVDPSPPLGPIATPLPHRWRRPPERLVLAGVALGLIFVAVVYKRSLAPGHTVRGVRAGGVDVGDLDDAALATRVGSIEQSYLDHPIRFALGDQAVTATRREAGLIVDHDRLQGELRTIGRSGDPLADLSDRARARRGTVNRRLLVSVDRARALEFLSDIKDQLDRPAADAKLDLEHHKVTPEQQGTLMQVYQSLVALEYAAQDDAEQVQLAAVVTPPKVTTQSLSDIDISNVMASWQTAYSMAVVDSDRTYNLKVGAGKVDGTVIGPHQTFSFNQVTGDRTEKEGYRVAPVIQAGELIDGLAGGMCQIASTLHAASWFAGLDILESTPHSRPSAYITMGLDSTVVYPTVDLKLRNPYDFPVVIHYRVNQGYVRAEILGKPRGKRVAFEREIVQEIPFETTTRTDPTMPAGQKLIDQEGHAGYRLKRRRVFLPQKGEKAVGKPQERAIAYPPTTQFVRIGTGGPKLPKKPIPPSHHIPPPEKPNTKEGFYRLIK